MTEDTTSKSSHQGKLHNGNSVMAAGLSDFRRDLRHALPGLYEQSADMF